MTKKDYELIAETLKSSYEDNINKSSASVGAISLLIQNFALNLETTNPRFNREMFLKACGVN